jgi:peptidoglycan/LPS O-acetylase OafA/YrhL
MQRPTGSSYVPTLDGWRAVAILGVLLCHAANRGSVLELGELGVTLFFGISGFLITHRMMRERDGSGRLSLRNFYVRRAFRILPPALVYLAVVLLLGRLGVLATTGAEVLACLAFARNYVTAGFSWYTAHFWSLSVEEHFYLLWPALFVLAGHRRTRWLAPGLALLGVLWRTLDHHYEFVAQLAHDAMLAGNPYRSDYCFDALFWGCTLALWLPLLRRAPALFGTPLCLLTAVLVIGSRYLGVPHFGAIAGLGMAVLLACTVLKPQGVAGQLLEWAPLRYVGRISYSLYLWQQLFLSWNDEKLPWQHLPVNLALAVACALVSYYVVERPLITTGRRFTPALRPRVAVAAD